MAPVGSYRSDAQRHAHDTLSSDFIAEHHAYLACLQEIDYFGFDVIFNNALHYVPVTMSGMISTPMLTVLHTPPFFEMINAIAAQYKRGGGHYCTVSRANAKEWASFNARSSRHFKRYRPSSNGGQRMAPVGAHAFWYGRLVADKGAHLAIDAARLAGVALRIAGQAIDPAYFAQEILPRLSDDVVYLGHLSRAELVDEVGRASICLVTPRWNEPFGLVVAEAIACGTPVAAFSRGAIPELLTTDTGVLAMADSVTALAAALLSARTLDRAACRRHAQANWGIDLMVTRYEALLASVARVKIPDYG